jgi:hypothetical protein
MINNIENIDRYFGGEMDVKEMQHFEEKVAQDPELSKEFSFQKEMVEGIQAVRKAELKATLANIDVSSIPTGLEVSTLTKILGGVTIAGVVAVGTYFSMGDQEAEAPLTTGNTTEVVEPITAEEQALTRTEEASPVTIAQESVPVEIVEEAADTPVKEVVEEKIIAENEPIVISEAKVSEGFEDETEVSETEAPTNHLIAKSKVTHSTLEVSIQSSKKYTFHYSVKNNALALYGDFSNIYEIIEFHKDGNIDTYLKYDEKYYEIDKLQVKATPLMELTGDGLLHLLDSIENNKER